MLKLTSLTLLILSASKPALALSCAPPSREMIVECNQAACAEKVGIKKGIHRSWCFRKPSEFQDAEPLKTDALLAGLRRNGKLLEVGLHEVAVDFTCNHVFAKPPRPDSTPERLENLLARCLARTSLIFRPSSSIEGLKLKWRVRFLYENNRNWIILITSLALLEIYRRRLRNRPGSASTVAAISLIGLSFVWAAYCLVAWVPDNYILAGLLPFFYGFVYLGTKPKGTTNNS